MDTPRVLIPVRSARRERENLICRSQAKQLIAQFEKCRHVVLDFEGIDQIGPAFADEIFRVFATQHPKTIMAPMNMTAAVAAMVKRARGHEAGASAAR